MQDAVARVDTTTLERLVAPDFTSVGREGYPGSRASFLKQMASGALRIQKAESTEQVEDELVMSGTRAATRTTMLRFQLPATGRDVCVKARFVYARLDDGWRLISLQETQLHDGPIVTSSYDDVVGTYEVAGGRSFMIAKKGRTLFGTVPREPPVTYALFETPDGDLVGPGGEFAYRLERDASNRVTAVTMTRYGKQMWRATRIVP
jgi:hypothetical protein